MNSKNIHIRLAGLWLASLFIFQSCSTNQAQPAQIIVANDFSSVALKGVSTTDRDVISNQLQLFISNEMGQVRVNQNPVTGSYQLDGALVRFTPSYPLLKGKSYLVRYDNGDTLIEQKFDIPGNTTMITSEVAQVYPSAKILPLNVLKFYIQFTDSMARGFAYENLHFVNTQGDTLEEVYLDLQEELWSPDMKRFTLLLDPGRIKRGLQSLEDLGYVFQQGGEYSLIVNKEWRDAHDQPMKAHFVQTFTTKDFLEKHAANFHIDSTPGANTLKPLTLRSTAPNDYALLQRVIDVVNDKGQAVSGNITLAQEERLWQFTPTSPWQTGNYEIRIETILEDLAGNNLINAFDVDNEKDETNLTPQKYSSFPFKIKE